MPASTFCISTSIGDSEATSVLPTTSSRTPEATAPRRWCLPVRRRTIVSSVLPSLELSDGARIALAQLLPLLGCGEEAAALAFDVLAEADDDAADAEALRTIAEEERVHDALLRSLADQLDPPAIRTGNLVERSRRFQQSMSRGDSTDHLARIAALDSAVCLIISKLLKPGAPLTACRVTAGIF